MCTFSSLMLRGFLLLIGLWVLSRLFSLYLCSFYFQVLTSQKNLSCFLRAFLECMPMAFGISDSPFPPQPAPPLVVIRQELSGLISHWHPVCLTVSQRPEAQGVFSPLPSSSGLTDMCTLRHNGIPEAVYWTPFSHLFTIWVKFRTRKANPQT